MHAIKSTLNDTEFPVQVLIFHVLRSLDMKLHILYSSNT